MLFSVRTVQQSPRPVMDPKKEKTKQKMQVIMIAKRISRVQEQ